MSAGDGGIDYEVEDQKLRDYIEALKEGNGRNLSGHHKAWEEYAGHEEDMRFDTQDFRD